MEAIIKTVNLTNITEYIRHHEDVDSGVLLIITRYVLPNGQIGIVQQAVADMLGCSREHVSVVYNKLRRNRVLRKIKMKFYLTDHYLLRS